MQDYSEKEAVGVFKYPYFSETVDIYRILEENYSNFSHYFSEYLKRPSVCLETKEKKIEFYVCENSMQNNEVWLYSNCKTGQTSGFGYGAKLIDLKQQVIKFLEECKITLETKQFSIFDFM